MKRAPRLLLALLLLAVGAAIGWTLRGGSPEPPAAAAGPQKYLCSMHPQYHLDRPGTCPICDMPLVPAGSAQGPAGAAPTLQLSDHALSMANVETVAVERRDLTRELRLVGKVEFNEESLATITPRVDGYAERLFVTFTGVTIKAGDHLVEVYSPELLVAQQELLIALQGNSDAALVDTAKTKLKLLGLTEAQVQNLVDKREIAERITLFSPISGTVIEKSIVEKAAFRAGEPIYRIANLDTVWVYVDVYEYDLPWIRYGQQVSIAAEALPSSAFSGMVTFVQPVVNELTRTIRVPIHVDNKGQLLKPGMFVSAVVHAALGAEGQAAPTGVEGKHTCPMHPQVLQDAPGACPVCEMPLEAIPGKPAAAPPEPAAARYQCPMKCEAQQTYGEPGKCPVCGMAIQLLKATGGAGASLAIPVSAVLDSGTRKLVYVARHKGLFEPRDVVLGPRAGAYYAVLQGLAEGEAVVVRGNLLIDSQFQITGQPSLLYPGGLHQGSEHQHKR